MEETKWSGACGMFLSRQTVAAQMAGELKAVTFLCSSSSYKGVCFLR